MRVAAGPIYLKGTSAVAVFTVPGQWFIITRVEYPLCEIAL